MPFVQCLCLEVFVERILLSHLKTLKTVAMETKVCRDQALNELSEKLNSRLLVQEEHGFQKGHIVPLGHRRSKKAWPG